MSDTIDDENDWKPIKGSEAFSGRTISHVNSQVSQLLCIATALRGRDPYEVESDEQLSYDLEVRTHEASHWDVPLPREAARTNLNISLSALTTLALPGGSSSTGRGNANAYVAYTPAGITSLELPPTLTRTTIEYLYTNIRAHRSSRAALALLNIATRSEHERVQVAAMAALHLLHPPSKDTFYTQLVQAAESSDNQVATLAEVALADASHSAPATGNEPFEIDEYPENKRPQAPIDSLSITVHGTFARISPKRWYIPSEPLPKRIVRECSHDLDQSSTYFRWSGQYNKSQREFGARQLIEWCQSRGVSCLDTVYAHSHGGNVVMDAIKLGGIKVKLLVLMHVPVLPRSLSEWQLIESRVGWVLDLRTPNDWVVRLDSLRNFSRNGFGYNLMCVTRPAGPVVSWLNSSHGYFIQDRIWEKKQLTNEVNFERASIINNRKAANMGQFVP